MPRNMKKDGGKDGGQRAPKPRTRKSPQRLLTLARSSSAAMQDRITAITELPLQNEEALDTLLEVLRDAGEPVEVRLVALQALGAARFSMLSFEACRGDYLEALRQVAQDPDPELRQRVLGILAREKDRFAQERLLEGLRDPEKALVPPEKALQLLSYDIHSEAYPVAREIVADPPSPVARREALRLLAADAESAPLFERILRDKDEVSENRRFSAAVLQSLRPALLQEHAREILLDADDYPEIQATSLTAITQFGSTENVAGDDTLLQRVSALHGEGPAKVKRSAQQFLKRYER